jgi:hypothetical protein
MAIEADRIKCKNLQQDGERKTDLALADLPKEGLEVTPLRYGLNETTRPTVIPALATHFPVAWAT